MKTLVTDYTTKIYPHTAEMTDIDGHGRTVPENRHTATFATRLLKHYK